MCMTSSALCSEAASNLLSFLRSLSLGCPQTQRLDAIVFLIFFMTYCTLITTVTISSKCSEMLFQCPGSTTTSELKRSFSCLKEQSNGLARCMLCSQASRCSSPTWKSTAWNWTREVGADQNIRTGFFKSSQISPSSRFIPTLTVTQRPIRPIHSTTSYNNKAEGLQTVPAFASFGLDFEAVCTGPLTLRSRLLKRMECKHCQSTSPLYDLGVLPSLSADCQLWVELPSLSIKRTTLDDLISPFYLSFFHCKSAICHEWSSWQPAGWSITVKQHPFKIQPKQTIRLRVC